MPAQLVALSFSVVPTHGRPFRRLLRCLCLLVMASPIASWSSGQEAEIKRDPGDTGIPLVELSEPLLRSHIRFLADDLLEGRGPGTRGDKLTQLYLRCTMEGLGVQPGAGKGQWYQQVPLVGVTTLPPARVSFRHSAAQVELTHGDDIMLNMGAPVNEAAVEDAELVFVGYGIQAPEYQWDDFKDVDVRGKILVIMNNDPASSPDLFAGRRRLYYGRWDYKYQKAADMGAAGALIIHTTPSAGYPYQVVRTSWAGEQFELADDVSPAHGVQRLADRECRPTRGRTCRP
ncbi:MAG: hypothetical protein KatS3mg111_3582 [Pirellulaceae bacterium]|nr:MAG: hypothetical protein KatS3mg111_3582 [Pirellulaceae bacterium]